MKESDIEIVVNLKNGFFFKGKILWEDDEKIEILDIKNHKVLINKSEIVVRENFKNEDS